jgi:hypothetical protein
MLDIRATEVECCIDDRITRAVYLWQRDGGELLPVRTALEEVIDDVAILANGLPSTSS